MDIQAILSRLKSMRSAELFLSNQQDAIYLISNFSRESEK